MWKKLKADIIKLIRMRYIIANNKHILKLVNKVKKLTIINKKQESLTAVIYAGILRKSLAEWQGPL